ncbi:sulfonate transport system permease protein [Streptosporangium becharense]|uniref:Sulfonate transport system permease protein n=1 Tax=Streptosporangium becharense TaxID=1816182 RepID=A0A7W9MIN5_9ACTN|nr:ABC transporter permease [Streptosporangium becharense]MBB2911229.1 sulfonate transport system permease protein [Streptosporangium becharense]MBB5821713.1 sulfonate transport system permease protein [Streptosporangium becharense]
MEKVAESVARPPAAAPEAPQSPLTPPSITPAPEAPSSKAPTPKTLSPQTPAPQTPSSQAPAPKAPSASPALETPRYLGTRRRRPAVSAAVRVLVPLLLLAAWWYGTDSGAVPPDVLAGPGAVAGAFGELVATGQLGEYLLASARRAGLGVLVGGGLGLLLGVVAGLSALGEELIDPTMQMKRAVPFLALVPLFISWFGVEETFKVVLIAVAAVGPMYAYSYLGVRGVDRKTVEAARGFGLRGARLAAEVIIPTALPNILMALRICLSVSLTGLIAAEQIGATEGIGYLVTLAQQYYRSDYMVLCILIYAVLGLVIDLLIRGVERLAMPWRGQVAAR